ncbi:uroporphyrinogen-III C-methyltransferase [Alcaligenaceae bacterium LF4-65]|jgi:uroporphyrin-3 C-methyltransferase|uniref:Uroporphyrinogen-III C-methyltransferase n=1 Tax=Zwartia hollandica TaxID=324606 RepID=A0A953N4Z9_9BURK|nr:uroporphyrinogen-III C-methyltransferase [Zwartia hollandica]MBZ1349061.1 uroporphyrinogen-III C-methyltransferase [Zwartia hollandica]
MTDISPNVSPSSASAASSVPNEPVVTPVRARRKATGLSLPATLAIIFLLVAVVASAGAWFAQRRFETATKQIGAQVLTLKNQADDARRDAKHALVVLDAQQLRIQQAEAALRDAQSQFAALEQVWQNFNRGMEDSMLANDIDRLLTVAGQQLRVSGNVNNAILALEHGLSMLVRAERPRFAALQRAISADLDRLRGVVTVDIPGVSAKLEQVATLLGRAPLLLPDAAVPELMSARDRNASSQVTVAGAPANVATVQTTEASAEWWEKIWRQVRASVKTGAAFVVRELSDVISVQRVTDKNALLMTPEQGALLRANLRARLLTAQMALLMHQSTIWRLELSTIESAVASRYDAKSPDTINALRLLRELGSINIAVAIPDVIESVAALEAIRQSDMNPKGGQ